MNLYDTMAKVELKNACGSMIMLNNDVPNNLFDQISSVQEECGI